MQLYACCSCFQPCLTVLPNIFMDCVFGRRDQRKLAQPCAGAEQIQPKKGEWKTLAIFIAKVQYQDFMPGLLWHSYSSSCCIWIRKTNSACHWLRF